MKSIFVTYASKRFEKQAQILKLTSISYKIDVRLPNYWFDKMNIDNAFFVLVLEDDITEHIEQEINYAISIAKPVIILCQSYDECNHINPNVQRIYLKDDFLVIIENIKRFCCMNFPNNTEAEWLIFGVVLFQLGINEFEHFLHKNR